MAKKKNVKKQAFLQAQALLKKDLTLEPLPAGGGLVYVGLSFDMENIAVAEAVLVAAGYSGQQANVAINGLIKNLKDRAEGRHSPFEVRGRSRNPPSIVQRGLNFGAI
ncbi:MAG: hypothetical protein M1489_05980 [Firmicutes bacterium]|nr:hypothetical protein [Bacillota bacterium]